jgi:hypothetical protein
MSDFSRYPHIGTGENQVDYYLVDSDIMLAIPRPNFIDSPRLAQASANFQSEYARKIGKKCATIVIMDNVLSQDAETRRIYQDLAQNGLFFGAALVVNNPLSRALGSFFIGLSKPKIPMRLFDTVETGIEWIRTIRP